MKKRYTAHLFRRARYCHGWHLAQTRSFKSRCSARRWLERTLGSVETTRGNFHHDLARTDFGEIHDSKREGLLEAVEPEMLIVPSVGELGISP